MKRLNLFKFTLNALFLSAIAIAGAFAQTYEVPPSDRTSSSTPYISDEAMERCVVLWNETKWLGEEIDNIQVNQYSEASVDAYNNKVTRHTNMTNAFNRDCAGKQSESAYKAAQELNKKSKRR